jgi:hypothetical protein
MFTFKPQLLYPWEEAPPASIEYEARWAADQVWMFRRREHLLRKISCYHPQ